MIVAGEASGDAHAATLVRALGEAAPEDDFDFFGATGVQMRESGVDSIVRSDELAIMGIFEVGRVFPKFWRAFCALRDAACERKPDAVILVDWPEFNLRLARSLHRKGIRVIYYISPQVWAWRSYRARSIQRNVDLLLCILPFEPDWYKDHAVANAVFVGHPLTGEIHPRCGRSEFCAAHRFDNSRPLVALLPGSRHREVARILPPMLDAASVINRIQPEIQFVIALAASRPIEEAESIIANHGNVPTSLKVVQGETHEAIAAADVAAIASGTATLEAAIIGTPFVMAYRESRVNWHTLGRLITAEHYGLVNLIGGEQIVTELMQEDLTGEKLSSELLALLDQERNATMRARLHEVAAMLGMGDASSRAATEIMGALRKWKLGNEK